MNLELKQVEGYESSTLLRPKHFELLFASKPPCQDCAVITNIEGSVILARPGGKAPQKARDGSSLKDGDLLVFSKPAIVTISCPNCSIRTISEQGLEKGSTSKTRIRPLVC